ncbi:MAG: hypothetical protein HQL69_20020 [Magnetococcales bacterium]|nr:hypothetical protein [Magnetococcales bacterium]
MGMAYGIHIKTAAIYLCKKTYENGEVKISHYYDGMEELEEIIHSELDLYGSAGENADVVYLDLAANSLVAKKIFSGEELDSLLSDEEKDWRYTLTETGKKLVKIALREENWAFLKFQDLDL